MNSIKTTARIFEDVKINVKMKLSLLWVALMFFYLYNDVFTFFRAEHIKEVLTGEVAGIQITQVFLFGAAILMAIPSFMVFLSLILPAKVNRRTNIIVGIFHIVVLLATLFVPGELWAYYALYMIFEAVFIALIVWHAWKWPRQEG
ncbi:MAG: DUF6326 family protein [Candidatus Neomarinimicrobiota bacterium]